MSAPSYASEPQVQYLHQVLDQIAKGELLIPDFQRPTRWDDDQRRELLQSVSRGYPIGALMVWRTTKELACAKAIGDRIPPADSPTPARQYLLDGMQRLSTLFAALWSPARGQSDLPTREARGELARWRLGYHLINEEWLFLEDIEQNEVGFVVPGRILLNGVDLLRFQRKIKHERADELVERADQIANAIREYKLAIVPLVGDSVGDAAKTFTLVNRQGTPMSDLDLIHALTWSDEFHLRGLIDRAQVELHRVGWGNLDEKYFLAVIRGALDLDLYTGSPESVSERIKKDPKVVGRAAEAIRTAAEFLKSRCDVVSLDLLPYSYQAVLLADVFYRHPNPSEEINCHLVRWFWWTTAWATFAGISGYRLMGMVKYLRDLSAGKAVKWPRKRAEPTPLPATALPESARIHALVIHLFRMQGKPDSLRVRIEREGARALARGLGSDRSPSNMFLATASEEEGLQRALELKSQAGALARLLHPHPLFDSESFRKQHAISDLAWQLLGHGDIAGFFEERRLTLENYETGFIEALGKPPGCS